jgi:hypothetical protein
MDLHAHEARKAEGEAWPCADSQQPTIDNKWKRRANQLPF